MLPCSLAHASPRFALSGVPVCTGAHSRGGGVRVLVCVCVEGRGGGATEPMPPGACTSMRQGPVGPTQGPGRRAVAAGGGGGAAAPNTLSSMTRSVSMNVSPPPPPPPPPPYARKSVLALQFRMCWARSSAHRRRACTHTVARKATPPPPQHHHQRSRTVQCLGAINRRWPSPSRTTLAFRRYFLSHAAPHTLSQSSSKAPSQMVHAIQQRGVRRHPRSGFWSGSCLEATSGTFCRASGHTPPPLSTAQYTAIPFSPAA